MAETYLARVRTSLRNVFYPPESTPIDWSLIFTLYFSLFASALGITILFPFLPSMVKSFGYQEQDVGYYAGWIASSLFFGRIIGSYFWGWLADRIGRRPVFLICLSLSGITSLTFGFSSSLSWAIASRFLLGTVNGIVSLVKTVIFEACDNTNQSLALSVVLNAWSTGLVIGPAIGGYLAEPAEKYPKSFKDTIFDKYAYLLPCLFVSLASLLSCIPAFFYLRETLKSKETLSIKERNKHKSGTEITESDCTASSSVLSLSDNEQEIISSSSKRTGCEKYDSQSMLIGSGETGNPSFEHEIYNSPSSSSENHRKLEQNILDSNTRSCNSFLTKTFMKFRKSNQKDDNELCISYSNLQGQDEKCVIEEGTLIQSRRSSYFQCRRSPFAGLIKDSKFLKLIRTKEVVWSIASYCAMSFSVIGLNEIFSVWAATETKLGGLAYSTDQIGSVLLTVAICCLILQILINPKVERKFGAIKTFQLVSFILIFTSIVLPAVNSLNGRPTVLWLMLLVVYLPRTLSASCGFLAISIAINNSCPPDSIASVNGIAMTCTSIARALAPTVGGSIYSWSISTQRGFPLDEHLTFIFFAFFFWVALVLSTFLPISLNKQKEVVG